VKVWRVAAEGLVEGESEQPEPNDGEVLVRVRAAGVTPSELVWYPTTHTKDGGERSGAAPGHEFSGDVSKVGNRATDLQVGLEVYGMNDWFADGALADYCITRPEWIAPKPRSLSHAEAASAPIGALTAWQGLFERGRLRSGERVLVHGGAGAVGLFAVQMAHAAGARVVTTVSGRDVEFVKALGADEAIDYRAGSFEQRVGAVDLVFDTVGGETLTRSRAVLKPGGRLVTIAADASGAEGFFIVEARREELVEMARQIDAGELMVFVSAEVPFAEAGRAYGAGVERRGPGKMVVTLK